MISIERNMDSGEIVSLVSRLIAKGTDPAGICVLARNHYLLAKVSRMFDESNVSHSYIGRQTELVHSEPFIRYHAFLKLAINPMDNMAFLLIKDVIGTSREKYSAIRVMAAESGKSHFQTWFEVSGGDTLNIFQPDLSLAEICNEICTLYPELSPEASAFIYNWEKEHPDSIEEYLNWLALYEVQDEIKKETAGISLMTIHAAKGLEWPVVILTGINEGIIPSKQSVNANDVEAERRLFYVAMTRTRDQLIMTVRPETVEKDGRIFESPQSRFIAEAKEDELSILNKDADCHNKKWQERIRN